jgi:hypothetical protein
MASTALSECLFDHGYSRALAATESMWEAIGRAVADILTLPNSAARTHNSKLSATIMQDKNDVMQTPTNEFHPNEPSNSPTTNDDDITTAKHTKYLIS